MLFIHEVFMSKNNVIHRLIIIFFTHHFHVFSLSHQHFLSVSMLLYQGSVLRHRYVPVTAKVTVVKSFGVIPISLAEKDIFTYWQYQCFSLVIHEVFISKYNIIHKFETYISQIIFFYIPFNIHFFLQWQIDYIRVV